MIRLTMMARQTQDATVRQAVARAAELGLDGVDIHLAGLDRNPAQLARLRWDCLRRGLTIGYAGAGTLVGPVEEKAQRLQQARADVDAALLLGAQLVRVFARHRWPDTEVEQERLWGPMIESFQELADYAGERGAFLGVQNHDESSFCMTATQARRILHDVQRPNVGFLMDTGQWRGAIGSHPRGEADPDVDLYEDYLKPMAPHTISVRAKIYQIDGGTEAWLDYPRIVRLLQAAGFAGHIGLVFELGERNTRPRDECVALAVKHLRQVLGEAGA